jgi:branched-chain amino acid transport system permease protein
MLRSSARALWTPVVLIVGVVLLAQAAGGINASPALINLILVIGLYVFAGNSGVLSFGHVAFMALGAYTCALITIPTTVKAALLPHLPGFLAHAHFATTPAILVAAGFVGLVAFVVSIPLMRLSGLGAGIATLALLVIVTDFLTNDSALTGGSGNVSAIPSDLTEGQLLLWAIIAVLIAFAYQQSRSCRMLRAAREDELAARSVGIRVERERRTAFTLSAMITAVAGALYAHFLGSIGPGSFDLATTFLIVAMLVVGGIRSLTGAVIGAAVLSTVTTTLNNWEQGQSVLGVSLALPAATTQLVVAALMILVLIIRPEGISAGGEVPFPFSRRIRTTAATSPDKSAVAE